MGGLTTLAINAVLYLIGGSLSIVALNVLYQLVRRPLSPLVPPRARHVTDEHSPRQLAPRDPTRPPLVFHYVPVIGCAVSYGMDPLGFLDDCKRRVRALARYSARSRVEESPLTNCATRVVRTRLHVPSPREEDHCDPRPPREQLCPQR